MESNKAQATPGGCLIAASLVLVPGLLGAITGTFADGTVPTLLVLIGEPVLWFGMGCVALGAFAWRRWQVGVAALLGWLLFATAVRLPVAAGPELRSAIDLPRSARQCRPVAAEPIQGPTRIATWNAAGADQLEALDAVEADVFVLQEVRPSMVERAKTRWGADGTFVEAMNGLGTGILVRGGELVRCRTTGRTTVDDPHARSTWTFPLPAQGVRRAIAVLAFADLGTRGIVPILAVHLDRPARASEILGWPDQLERSGQRIATLARRLDLDTMVVAGDTNSHGTFRQFLGTIASASLTAAPPRPTWPSHVAGVPFPALYHLDRVWFGRAWSSASVETRRLDGSNHLAVVATLEPKRSAFETPSVDAGGASAPRR